jgi:hypothetical protein
MFLRQDGVRTDSHDVLSLVTAADWDPIIYILSPIGVNNPSERISGRQGIPITQFLRKKWLKIPSNKNWLTVARRTVLLGISRVGR